jgi:Tol biopolymer transport system component
MVLRTNFLVSATTFGGFGNDDSYNQVWSADGQWVIYQTMAYNLSCSQKLIFWNLLSRTNLLIDCEIIPNYPVFSPDSRFFAFVDDASGAFCVRDVLSNIPLYTIYCGAAVKNPSISSGGRYLVYEQNASVYLLDCQAGTSNLISRNWQANIAPADGNSCNPSITPDAQFVIYASSATNLVYNDRNNASDIFVWDRLRNVNICVSANSLGLPANSSSARPVLAADGRTVVFQSLASDLVEGDYNMKRDLFVLKLSAGDTDDDGMDDDWEIVYFSTLDRDGTGDFDNDGVTDKDEFLAGTSPANNTSVFRALTVTPAAGGPTTILWPSAVGCRYMVQFKNSVSDPTWTNFNAIIPGTGGTASYVDTETTFSPNQRFYRVVLTN